MNKKFRQGVVEGSTIVIILLALALIGAGTFGIWAFMNYGEAKSNLDTKLDKAAAEAKRTQSKEDEKKYLEEAKNPASVFQGPQDLGKVRFTYPKTWSVYVDADGSDAKDYFAYLNPLSVPPVPRTPAKQQRFALRVAIYNKKMDDVLDEFSKEIKKGELKSSQVTINGKPATKLEGSFPNPANKDDRIKGVAYYFKVNDKVLMIKTDANTFVDDLDRFVLKTIDFS